MPRVTFRQSLSNAADGEMQSKHLIDIPMMLSQHYGRLIRQGNAFRIKSAQLRVYNPNTATQDQQLGVSGRLVFAEPTKNRKSAWINAFKAVQNMRRLTGLKEKNYDFRVGLHDDYGKVMQQAWIRSDSNELNLVGGGQNGIFDVHNEQLNKASQPEDPDLNGFGFPFDFPGIGDGDADFKDGLGDNGFFIEGQASTQLESLGLTAGFAGVSHTTSSLVNDALGTSITPTDTQECDITAMCGLVGIIIDTTIPDDSTAQVEDTGVEITLDIESWSSLFK